MVKARFDQLVTGLGGRWPALAVVLLLGAFLFRCVAWVVRRGQDVNYDLLAYHYYSGYALLHGRHGSDLGAADLAGFLNPVANVWSYLAISQVRFPYSTFLILLPQLASVPLLLTMALALRSDRSWPQTTAAALATGIGLCTPMWWSELGTSFYSSSTAPLVLLACHWSLESTRRRPEGLQVRLVLGAGIALGLAAVLKLTNAPYLAAMLVAWPVAEYRWGGNLKSAWRVVWILLAGATAGVVVAGGWHMVMASRYGSPLFPFYNAIFRSDFSALENFRDERWSFEGLVDFARYVLDAASGTSKTSELRFIDGRYLGLAALSLAAGLVMAVRRFSGSGPARSGRAAATQSQWELLELFVAVGTLLWAVMFAYQRYLIPMDLLLGLLAWRLLLVLMRDQARPVVVVLAVSLVSSGLSLRIPDWAHIRPTGGTGAAAFGLVLPEVITRTPARYLLVGEADSFLAAFVHRESVVYRTDLGAGLRQDRFDVLARMRFSQADRLPLRVLGNRGGLEVAIEAARSRFGVPGDARWRCQVFSRPMAEYEVCELLDSPGLPAGSGRIEIPPSGTPDQ